MIREHLEQSVADWERLGHPALMERFVLRNGREFSPVKRIGKKGQPKNCFGNATGFVQHRMIRRGSEIVGPTYVEGFTLIKDLPVMAIHHAWVTIDGSGAMDPTVDAFTHEYFGVPFSTDVLLKETLKNRVYGLLDPGLGLNHRLMFAMDPELETICRAVIAKRKTMKEFSL